MESLSRREAAKKGGLICVYVQGLGIDLSVHITLTTGFIPLEDGMCKSDVDRCPGSTFNL